MVVLNPYSIFPLDRGESISRSPLLVNTRPYSTGIRYDSKLFTELAYKDVSQYLPKKSSED